MGEVEDRSRRAYLNGLAAVGLWSTVATAFKLSLRVLHPTQLLFLASLSSAGVLALVLLIQGRLARTFRQLTVKQALTSAGRGFLNPFLSLLLIQFILGEAIHPFTLVGLCLIVAGVALQQVSIRSN